MEQDVVEARSASQIWPEKWNQHHPKHLIFIFCAQIDHFVEFFNRERILISNSKVLSPLFP